MAKMTEAEYQQLIELLDGRIDKLTKSIPSNQILRFAEAVRHAELGDEDSVPTYGTDDYSNLTEALHLISEFVPPILADIRAKSIDPENGWRFEVVEAGNGDMNLCAVCRKPYQHFGKTVKVHTIDMHPNAYHGVCRECVGQHASLDFVESEGVEDWLRENRGVSPERVESDHKTENQRVHLIDAIRIHAHTTHYAADIARQSKKWADGAFGEWR